MNGARIVLQIIEAEIGDDTNHRSLKNLQRLAETAASKDRFSHIDRTISEIVDEEIKAGEVTLHDIAVLYAIGLAANTEIPFAWAPINSILWLSQGFDAFDGIKEEGWDMFGDALDAVGFTGTVRFL